MNQWRLIFNRLANGIGILVRSPTSWALISMSSALFTACTSRPRQWTVALLNGPTSLKSYEIRDGASLVVGRQIHRGLFMINPETGETEPYLAQSSRRTTDGRTMVIQLKSGFHFHDGTPVHCPAVQASLEQMRHLFDGRAWFLPKGLKFRCEGDETLFIEGKHQLPERLQQILSYPSAAVSKVENAEIGIGPYQLKDTTSNRLMLHWVGNPRSTSNKDRPQNLLFQIDTDKNLIQGFREGNIDDLSYLGLFQSLKDETCLRHRSLGPVVFWLSLNARHASLRTAQQRRHWVTILDDSLTRTNPFANESVTHSWIPFGLYTRPKSPPPLDPNEIRSVRQSLIADVKRNGLVRLTLRESTREAYNFHDWLRYLDPREELFKIEYVSNIEFFRRYQKQDLDIFWLGATMTVFDPFELLSFFRKNDPVNPSGVTESVIDQLLERSIYATPRDELLRLAREADGWVRDEGYGVPLFIKEMNTCISPRAKTYSWTPLGPFGADYEKIQVEP